MGHSQTKGQNMTIDYQIDEEYADGSKIVFRDATLGEMNTWLAKYNLAAKGESFNPFMPMPKRLDLHVQNRNGEIDESTKAGRIDRLSEHEFEVRNGYDATGDQKLVEFIHDIEHTPAEQIDNVLGNVRDYGYTPIVDSNDILEGMEIHKEKEGLKEGNHRIFIADAREFHDKKTNEPMMWVAFSHANDLDVKDMGVVLNFTEREGNIEQKAEAELFSLKQDVYQEKPMLANYRMPNGQMFYYEKYSIEEYNKIVDNANREGDKPVFIGNLKDGRVEADSARYTNLEYRHDRHVENTKVFRADVERARIRQMDNKWMVDEFGEVIENKLQNDGPEL